MLPHLIAWVEAQGGDPGAIREHTAAANLADPDLRVPEAMMDGAWRLAASISGDAAVGIHVAEFLPRGALDLVEYAFRSSASVGSAIERLARYGRVISDRVAGRIESSDNGLVLVIGDAGATPLHAGRADYAIAIVLKLARECAGNGITPRLVCFAHDAPKNTTAHERFFRAPVRFASGTNSMTLSAEDASRPLLSADAALEKIVRRRLEKSLSSRDPGDAAPLGTRVRRAIVDGLGRMIVTPDSVAGLFGISRRTLSRRLALESTSFSEIFDDTRRGLAQAMVRDRSLSVADIAFFLQYSEPSAFHRSFRRWTGQTPGAFRDSI